MRFKFEERRPDFFANSAYQATNEDTKTIRRLVADIRPSRVASIASGGEVPLTVMLPQASDGVWAVDICYGGLAWTALKALLLEHLGAKGVIDLFKGGAKGVAPPARWHHFRDLLVELSAELPDILKGRVVINSRDNSYNPFSAIYQLWDVETGRVDEKLLDATIERLGTLTLVHGDIRDLAGINADIYYTSNAITYGGAYDGKPISLDDLAPVLKQGGHVLATDNARYTTDKPHWQQLHQIPTPQGGYGNWTFYVFRYGRIWPKPLTELPTRIPGLRVGVLDEPLTSASIAAAKPPVRRRLQTLRRSR